MTLWLLALLPFVIFAVFIVVVATAYAIREFHYARISAKGTPLGLALFPLIFREAVAQVLVLAWFFGRVGSAHKTAGSGPPVVLAHGLAADGTCMAMFRRAIEGMGRPTYAPHLGRMFRPLERYSEKLADALEEALADHPEAEGVDVVCHSMGGIALREALRVRPDLSLRIRRVVTIASPHLGTHMAWHVPMYEARQLFVGAPWLTGLPSLRQLLPTVPITTIASRHDAVVYPEDTCCVDGSKHHCLSGIGHAELLVRRDIADLVVAALA